MYARACRTNDLREGGIELAAVNRTLVLIVWPTGGEPKAFQGFCPHAREPLGEAAFDGASLVCPYHDWVFEARTGRCTEGKACRLAEYPLMIRDEVVMVDTDATEPNYL